MLDQRAGMPGRRTLARKRRRFARRGWMKCFLGGARGGGKSYFLLADYVVDVETYGEHWHGVLFRRTYKELEELVQQSQALYPRIVPGARWVGSSQYTWYFPNGATLKLRHLMRRADVDDYQGHQNGWIGYDEVTNWPNLDLYFILMATLRNFDAPIPTKRVRASGNPGGVGHNAVKAYFVDPAPMGMVPITDPDTHRVRMLSGPSYKTTPRRGIGPQIINTPSPRRPVRKGANNSTGPGCTVTGMSPSAACLTMYGGTIAIASPPLSCPGPGRCIGPWIGGIRTPIAPGWWTQSDGTTLPDGRHYAAGSWIRIAVLYGWDGQTPNVGTQENPAQVAAKMQAVEAELPLEEHHRGVSSGIADDQIFSAENNIYGDFQTAKIHFQPAQKGPGSRATGWTRLRTLLEAAGTEDAGLYVFNTCSTFIRTLPVLTRHDIKIDDIADGQEDHCADEVRYMMTTPIHSITVKKLKGI